MSILPIVFEFSLGLMAISLVITFVRLVKGPSIPDRVVALDLVTMIIAAMMAVYMMYTDQAVFLDAIVILALIAFFSTVAFSIYLKKGVEK